MVQASAAVWFGADGFEVTGVREERGEVVVDVQTPDGQKVFCGRCGRRARSKGRREVCLRDAPAAGGRPVRVRWEKAGMGVPRPGVRGGVLDRAGGAGGAAPGVDLAGCGVGCGQAGGG